jgi:hypothetical protein
VTFLSSVLSRNVIVHLKMTKTKSIVNK